MKWADELMLGAVRAKMPLRLEILEHIFMAERIWVARIEGNLDQSHFTPPVGGEELAAAWETLHGQLLALAAAETDWTRVVSYKTLAGVESASPLWQIVLHLANHGSYHRGQVAATLRAAGFTPPGTDLITWYRLNLPA
jgi:uncharacterized damage-inducible protein DinB